MLDHVTIQRESVKHAVAYYSNTVDDYYAKDGSATAWQGAGAKDLHLSGSVDPKRFRELLEGQISENVSLRRTKSRDDRKERLGYDFTFSAPKSVSMQALIHGDADIIAIHDRAVTAAIAEAEKLARGRVTEKQRTRIENTQNLVVAKFRHETSREQDPTLHTHAIILNMTKRSDGQWRALDNEGIVRAKMYLGNVYKAELAKGLEEKGYSIRYNKKNGTFDLGHISDEQIQAFSQRSHQVEDELLKAGLTRETASSEQKSKAAMQSRKRKQKVDRETLQRTWQKKAAELGIDFDSREWAGIGADKHKQPEEIKPLELYADEAIKFSIRSKTERQSIVTESEIKNKALLHGLGKLKSADIAAALIRVQKSGYLIKETTTYRLATTSPQEGFKLTRDEMVNILMEKNPNFSQQKAEQSINNTIKTGRLVRNETRFTTKIAQENEREILEIEGRNRNCNNAHIPEKEVSDHLSQFTLNKEQDQAVRKIINTDNRFIGVQGFAGTGKSYMLKAAKTVLEANDIQVIGLAPYGSQVKVLKEEGLENSRTIAAFLKSKNKKITKNTVVMIDEAGVIPTRQMLSVMKELENAGARAVFMGDTAQTKAVEAGIPFFQLQKSGMDTAHLIDIKRQKNLDLLKAVKLAAKGASAASLQKIPVREIAEPEKRYENIADHYISLSPDDRSKTIIVTGTNESRIELNTLIRQKLNLEGTGIVYPLLERVDTTQAERRFSKYYDKGTVIIPEVDYKNGLKRGEQYIVRDNGSGNKLTVSSNSGEIIQFSPAQHKKLSVYTKSDVELAAGDKIRITRNNPSLDLANGDQCVVVSTEEGRLTIKDKNGKILKLEGSEIAYTTLAYAATVHSAQGQTQDRVLINAESKSLTTAQDVYYVAISRARHETIIFTDDAKKLPDAVSRKSEKSAALELKQLQQYMDKDRHYNQGQEKQSYQYRRSYSASSAR